MASPTRPLRILLATSSELKFEAVKSVWGPNVKITRIPAVSGVPEQPRGIVEAREGARARLCFAVRQVEKRGWNLDIFDYVVAIESYIDDTTRAPRDRAFVLLHDCEHAAEVVSEPVRIHTSYRYNPDVTWGQDLRAKYGVDPKDPHLFVSDRSRAAFLVDALTACKAKLEASERVVPTPTAPLQSVATLRASEPPLPMLPSSLLTFVQDFPKPGVRFVDVNALLRDPMLWRDVVERCVQLAQRMHCTGIVALDARGFLLGPLLAHAMGLPCTLIRKAGKLPGDVVSTQYKMEYRKEGDDDVDENVLEMAAHAFTNGDRVLIVDDILATGGTVGAAEALITTTGAEVAGTLVLYKVPKPAGCDGAWGDALDNVHAIFADPVAVSDDEGDEHKGSEVVHTMEDGDSIEVMAGETRVTLTRVGVLSGSTEHKDNVAVLSHPDYAYLVAWRHTYVPMSWDKFPDGSPNLYFPAEQLQHKHVYFFMSFDRADTVLDQLHVVQVLGRQEHVLSVTIVIPYLSVGTMERVDREGVVATAETLLRMMTTNMPSAADTKTKLIIGDPHANIIRFFISDSVVPRMVRLYEADCFTELFPPSAVLVYPDEGARKRYMASKHYKNRPSITCIKRRVGDKRVVEVATFENFDFENNDDVDGRPFFVVDDLVRSGGTLISCARAVRAKLETRSIGVEMYAAVTHWAFDGGAERQFLNPDTNPFTRFFGFDTVPRTRGLDGHGPFRLLSSVPVLAPEV